MKGVNLLFLSMVLDYVKRYNCCFLHGTILRCGKPSILRRFTVYVNNAGL